MTLSVLESDSPLICLLGESTLDRGTNVFFCLSPYCSLLLPPCKCEVCRSVLYFCMSLLTVLGTETRAGSRGLIGYTIMADRDLQLVRGPAEGQEGNSSTAKYHILFP